MTASELRCGLFALLLMALASAAFGAGARAQSYEDGMRAYDAGDIAKALEIWGPVAENGDAVAQYSLGKLLENADATVTSFVRYEVGEGIEKKEENFAAEVKKQIDDAKKKDDPDT